jgi:hypothetical protein
MQIFPASRENRGAACKLNDCISEERSPHVVVLSWGSRPGVDGDERDKKCGRLKIDRATLLSDGAQRDSALSAGNNFRARGTRRGTVAAMLEFYLDDGGDPSDGKRGGVFFRRHRCAAGGRVSSRRRPSGRLISRDRRTAGKPENSRFFATSETRCVSRIHITKLGRALGNESSGSGAPAYLGFARRAEGSGRGEREG